MIEKHYYRVQIHFTEPILGSQSTKDVTTDFISKRAGFAPLNGDEIDALPDALERGTTVFHRGKNGQPMLLDYHVKGFLKEAGRILNKRITVGGKPVLNLRNKVGNDVFVSPRQIPLKYSGEIAYNERPLRAETAQGPRVALARSEQIDGASIEFGLTVYPGEITEEVLRDILDYGFDCGIGQWRSAGWGRFRYTLTSESVAGD
jgi:hypothetical protein